MNYLEWFLYLTKEAYNIDLEKEIEGFNKLRGEYRKRLGKSGDDVLAYVLIRTVDHSDIKNSLKNVIDRLEGLLDILDLVKSCYNDKKEKMRRALGEVILHYLEGSREDPCKMLKEFYNGIG